MGLDIGPDSIKKFSEVLDTTKTVIWNGPMGVFEFEKFALGTEVCFTSSCFLVLVMCDFLSVFLSMVGVCVSSLWNLMPNKKSTIKKLIANLGSLNLRWHLENYV